MTTAAGTAPSVPAFVFETITACRPCSGFAQGASARAHSKAPSPGRAGSIDPAKNSRAAGAPCCRRRERRRSRSDKIAFFWGTANDGVCPLSLSAFRGQGKGEDLARRLRPGRRPGPSVITSFRCLRRLFSMLYATNNICRASRSTTAAGSSVTPVLTGDTWIIVLRGDVSQ